MDSFCLEIRSWAQSDSIHIRHRYYEGFQVLFKNMAPPAAPVKKPYKKPKVPPVHKKPECKEITIGYMAGKWSHSKTGAIIEVTVVNDEVSVIRAGQATKTCKSHQVHNTLTLIATPRPTALVYTEALCVM